MATKAELETQVATLMERVELRETQNQNLRDHLAAMGDAKWDKRVQELDAQVADLEADLAAALSGDALVLEPEEIVGMNEVYLRLAGERDQAVRLLREYAGEVDLGRDAGDFGGRVRAFLDQFN